jgi:hypothetical protein
MRKYAFNLMGVLLASFPPGQFNRMEPKSFIEALQSYLDVYRVTRAMLCGLQVLAQWAQKCQVTDRYDNLNTVLGIRSLLKSAARKPTLFVEVMEFYRIGFDIKHGEVPDRFVEKMAELKMYNLIPTLLGGVCSELTPKNVDERIMDFLFAVGRDTKTNTNDTVDMSAFFQDLRRVCIDILYKVGHPCSEIALRIIAEFV